MKLGRRVNLPCPDCSRLFSFLVSNFAALDLKQRATTRLQSDKESLADSQWKQGQSAGTRKKVRRGRHDADLSQTSRARAAPRAPGNSPNIHHKHTAPASLWAGPRHHVPVAERPANEPPGRKRGRGTAHAGPAAVGRRIIGQAESPMGRPAQSGLGWSPWLGRAGVVGMTSNGPLLGPLGRLLCGSCLAVWWVAAGLGPAGAAPDRRSGPCLRGNAPLLPASVHEA